MNKDSYLGKFLLLYEAIFVLIEYLVNGLIIQTRLAFRRTEIIFDARLLQSCVGGVAGAMAVASIFLLEFWFLCGVVLGSFWA